MISAEPKSYTRPREAVEPIVGRVEWRSRALPASSFRRDGNGRWHLTSWRGDSFHSIVEGLRCRPDGSRWTHRLCCRGWSWLELTLRLDADGGPVVIDEVDAP